MPIQVAKVVQCGHQAREADLAGVTFVPLLTIYVTYLN